MTFSEEAERILYELAGTERTFRVPEALTSIINLVDKEAKDCELPCTCKAQERGAYMHKLTCAENHNITVQNLRAIIK
jgi:hypothetical protein